MEEQGSAESKEIETLWQVHRGASQDFEQLDRIQEIEDDSEVLSAAERAQPPRENHETALEALDKEAMRM